MKILHVIPSIARSAGGPTVALAMIVRSLQHFGVAVTIASTTNAREQNEKRAFCDDANCDSKNVYLFHRNFEFYKPSVAMLVWLARNITRFDVVHVHALFSFTSVIAASLAKWRGVPYVVRPLGTLAPYAMRGRKRWLKTLSFAIVERRLLRGAARVHFTSRQEECEAARLGVRLRSAVIPLGIEPTGSVPELDSTDRTFGSEVAPCVLFLGRIDPKKNLNLLLAAFARVRTDVPEAILFVAGAGKPSYVAHLVEQADSLGIACSVRWLGHVVEPEKSRVFEAARLFVLASENENFGIAVVEALSHGLPCIVSASVAISEEIERAGAGCRVSNDEVAIANAINRYLGDPALWRGAAEAARRLALSRFSASETGRGLSELYREICAGK